jgi:hypothetical protein
MPGDDSQSSGRTDDDGGGEGSDHELECSLVEAKKKEAGASELKGVKRKTNRAKTSTQTQVSFKCLNCNASQKTSCHEILLCHLKTLAQAA